MAKIIAGPTSASPTRAKSKSISSLKPVGYVTQIILGTKPLSDFDKSVDLWYKQGGWGSHRSGTGVHGFPETVRESNPKQCMGMLLGGIPLSVSEEKGENMKKLIEYGPAAVWEEAFPLGNGALGAMVYGGVPGKCST